MRRLFKEFLIGRTLDHVLFERQVRELWELFHSTWRAEHYGNPCKGMTLKMFTGFIKKEGIIVASARRKPLKFFKPKGHYKHPIYEGIGYKMPPQYE